MVDWNTLSIELATKHFCANGHAEHIASELTMGMRVVNTSGSFENLQIRALENTGASLANGRVGECFLFRVLRPIHKVRGLTWTTARLPAISRT